MENHCHLPIVQEPLTVTPQQSEGPPPVFCEHFEALQLELEALYGHNLGSAQPTLTMNDVAGIIIHCLV